MAFSHSLYLSTICVIVGCVHLDVLVVRPDAYGLNTPYRLWLAAAGTSLTLETALETASTGQPHINPSEN